MRYIAFLIILFFPLTVFSQKDTLFFNNGTIVIGEISKIQLGVITFDPDDANDITVQLRKLKHIVGSRNFRIETVDLQVIFGKLNKSPHAGFANITYGSDTTIVALSNISNLYPIEKNFSKRITGFISAGYSYTRSSDLGRINLDGSASYLAKELEFKINGSAISTIENDVFSRENENLGIKVNYYYHPVWFVAGMLNYQRNEELGIKSRFQEGGGVGNKLLLTRYVRMLGFGAIVVNQETSFESDKSLLLTEGMLGFSFNVFRFEKPELDIQTTQYGFFSFSQDRMRYEGDISVNWEMIEDFDLKLSFYTDYDSNPPGSVQANIDYGTVISLAYEF